MVQPMTQNDEKDPRPPVKVADWEGASLDTLGDVRREHGRLYRRLMGGKVDTSRAGVASNLLTSLSKSMESADITQFSDQELLAEVQRRRGLKVLSGSTG